MSVFSKTSGGGWRFTMTPHRNTAAERGHKSSVSSLGKEPQFKANGSGVGHALIPCRYYALAKLFNTRGKAWISLSFHIWLNLD